MKPKIWLWVVLGLIVVIAGVAIYWFLYRPQAAVVSPSVSLTANGQSALTIKSGDAVTLAWTIAGDNMSASKYCSATPAGWFPTDAGLTGTAVVKPTTTTTYKLSCWPAGNEAAAVSGQVIVTIAGASTSTNTNTSTTAPSTTATPSTTTKTATTGPETPLVAGGLLGVVLGAFYWVRRQVTK